MATANSVLRVPVLSSSVISNLQSELGISTSYITAPQKRIEHPTQFYHPYDIASDIAVKQGAIKFTLQCWVVPMFDVAATRLKLADSMGEFLPVKFINQTGIAYLANGSIVQTTPPFFWVNESDEPTYAFPSYMDELHEEAGLIAEWLPKQPLLNLATFVGAVHVLTSAVITSG